MEISKLKTLAMPSLNDVLPILDINGGVSGKPILRKATLSSLLALVETDNNQDKSSFAIPTTIKSIAASTDYFIGIDSQGIAYKISKADLLAGLSSSGSTGAVTSESDPYFEKVILLLKGIGVNNTIDIIDSSKNKFTSSRINNPVISGTKGKFDSTSIYFDNNSALNYTSSAFNFAENYTIDLWFNTNNSMGERYGETIFDFRPDNTSTADILLSLLSNKLQFYRDGNLAIESAPILSNDIFYYVGIKRVNDNTEMWLNGSLVGTCASNSRGSSSRLLIGGNAFRGYAPDTYFHGYISGFRVTETNRDLSIIPTKSFPIS